MKWYTVLRISSRYLPTKRLATCQRKRRGRNVLDRYISVQDMIGIGIIIGAVIKLWQFYKEGKL